MAEYDATGTRMARYAYLPGDYSPSEVELNNVTYQVRTDHLGTPLELVNAANDVVWRAHYESFGNAVIEDDVDGDGTHIAFNIRLPGQYFDAESGLNYNVARYYSTETGRYISSDPIGLNGGINTYSYVLNNPLIYMDPKGKYTLAGAAVFFTTAVILTAAAQQALNNSSNSGERDIDKWWKDNDLPNPDDYPKSPDDDNDDADDPNGSGPSEKAAKCREKCSDELGSSCGEALYRDCLKKCMSKPF
jgi:RHS repeat-associated protein